VDLSLPSILNNVAGGHEKFVREQRRSTSRELNLKCPYMPGYAGACGENSGVASDHVSAMLDTSASDQAL
jgi:hypothetical protein